MNPYQQTQAAPAPSQSATRLPKKEHLDYIKVVVEVLLLLLAVPWIFRELVRNPRQASQRAAAKHLARS